MSTLESIVKAAACVAVIFIVIVGLVSLTFGPLLPGVRRYHKTKKLRLWHRWAVVEMPLRVQHYVANLHTFRWMAIPAAGGCSTCRVMRASEAKAHDKRLPTNLARPTKTLHLDKMDDTPPKTQ
jgi:hypothetical protein